MRSFRLPEENVTDLDLCAIADWRRICNCMQIGGDAKHLACFLVLIDLIALIYGITLSPFSFSFPHLAGKL